MMKTFERRIELTSEEAKDNYIEVLERALLRVVDTYAVSSEFTGAGREARKQVVVNRFVEEAIL